MLATVDLVLLAIVVLCSLELLLSSKTFPNSQSCMLRRCMAPSIRLVTRAKGRPTTLK